VKQERKIEGITMTKPGLLWASSIVSVVLAACAGAPEPKPAEDVKKAADQMQKGADNMAKGAEGMAKGFEDLAKGLSAMASGGDPNAKPVEPLSIDSLKSVLPELSGWERSKPTGERMTAPVNYAEAEVRFTKGDSQVTAKIVDSALNQMLVAPFAMFLAAGYEKETERGYEKGVKVGDYPGWEKWDSESKDGELNAIVNKRFIVQIEGRQIDNVKILHNVMDSTDLKKLADFK
jgi:hypothetical protein